MNQKLEVSECLIENTLNGLREVSLAIIDRHAYQISGGVPKFNSQQCDCSTMSHIVGLIAEGAG